MNRLKTRLRLAGAGIVLLAAGLANAQTYTLNLPLEDDPDTVLQTITVNAKQTRVTVLLKNTTSDDSEMCAHPNGSPEAFSLKVLDTGEVLPQTGVSGLSNCQVRRETLRPGKRKTLQISFPPLPAEATRVELGEFSCQPNPDPDTQNWCFRDVALPKKR